MHIMKRNFPILIKSIQHKAKQARETHLDTNAHTLSRITHNFVHEAERHEQLELAS